ncbi:hypothetical protein AAT19DRAFT_13742 [Rhodotorula toruloides]|uniref:Ubiquitin-like domain-containing protein n=1 Tax=Rhodotorula toruloides TaxID=5286 RepID=A0A2T0ACF9_RHOTO|nr:hypothetical protein AAT19DRAFT_13742 [Rhodotorula toruloides]
MEEVDETLAGSRRAGDSAGEVVDVDPDCDERKDRPCDLMQVFVKASKTVIVLVNPDSPVLDLKLHVEEKLRIPPEQQRLIFAGRQLDDTRLLSEYAIQSGSTLHLVGRLRGGTGTHDLNAAVQRVKRRVTLPVSFTQSIVVVPDPHAMLHRMLMNIEEPLERRRIALQFFLDLSRPFAAAIAPYEGLAKAGKLDRTTDPPTLQSHLEGKIPLQGGPVYQAIRAAERNFLDLSRGETAHGWPRFEVFSGAGDADGNQVYLTAFLEANGVARVTAEDLLAVGGEALPWDSRPGGEESKTTIAKLYTNR